MEIGSPKNTRLNTVAKTGVAARIKTTLATLVSDTASTNPLAAIPKEHQIGGPCAPRLRQRRDRARPLGGQHERQDQPACNQVAPKGGLLWPERRSGARIANRAQ